jgi:glutamine synthetase
LLKHARAFTAVTNATVNSYKRLVSGYEAPVHVAWAHKNRSPLIRVPAKRGNSTRIELRSPDPTCNPYLAFAAMIRAGLDGIRNNLLPPEPVEMNIYRMSKSELRDHHLDLLPGSLAEAVDALRKSDLMLDTLGQHIFDNLIRAQYREWEEYRIQVTDWEIERYLNKF